MINKDRTAQGGMTALWDELVDRIERDLRARNEAPELQPERHVILERPTKDSLRLAGTTYGKVRVDDEYQEAPCPFFLHVYLRASDKKVTYEAEPKMCEGSLCIAGGAGGQLAFFENGHEVSVKRAARAILERFLDLTGKPFRR